MECATFLEQREGRNFGAKNFSKIETLQVPIDFLIDKTQSW